MQNKFTIHNLRSCQRLSLLLIRLNHIYDNSWKLHFYRSNMESLLSYFLGKKGLIYALSSSFGCMSLPSFVCFRLILQFEYRSCLSEDNTKSNIVRIRFELISVELKKGGIVVKYYLLVIHIPRLKFIYCWKHLLKKKKLSKLFFLSKGQPQIFDINDL